MKCFKDVELLSEERKQQMTSLKQKYFFLNGFCASVSIGAIAFLFFVCNRGFGDLVNISAKNLDVLYTTGELKSLLWKEISASNAYMQNNTSDEKVHLIRQKVSALAKVLEAKSVDEFKEPILKFIQIHDELLSEITRGNSRKATAQDSAAVNELYDQGYEMLNEFSESVLLGSQEQQGESIRNTNLIMKAALFGTVAGTFIILLFSFLYFKKRIVNPIGLISQASLRAARGEFHPIEGAELKDEIGILAVNFNHMMQEVRSAADSIRAERDIAEKANHAKSAFLANMSHELRTPMHGILSFAKFGQQKSETAAKEKLKSYFDEIYESGSRLMILLNDILDLSKLEAGKITYSVEQGDLVEQVRTVVVELSAYAEEKKLRLEILSSGPALCFFDAIRIMQVIRNILTNAIKFSQANSVIRIEFESSTDLLRCKITNQGIGIPPSELKTIFDKFIQSSNTKTGAGGTGLGLAICKEIMGQHGGRIWAESETSGETRFIFELPRPTSSPARKAS